MQPGVAGYLVCNKLFEISYVIKFSLQNVGHFMKEKVSLKFLPTFFTIKKQDVSILIHNIIKT